jgi:hypothetical protein
VLLVNIWKLAGPVLFAATVATVILPATAFAQQKTVKACEDEWKADKAANQAKKITEKDYVAKCRAVGEAAKPAAAPKPATAATPSTPAPKPAAATPPATPAAKPAAATPAAAPAAPKAAAPAPAAAPTAATAPTGAKQYAAEAQAKGQCPTDTVVWANLDSKIFHFAGHKDYGHTKKGAYMCEKDALAQNIRAAKDEKHP